MRRAGRIIYNGAMAVSLLLCLGTVAVWVRSYWVSDYLSWSQASGEKPWSQDDYMRISKGGLQFGNRQRNSTSFGETDNGHLHHFRESVTEFPLFENTADGAPFPFVHRYGVMGFEIVPQFKMREPGSPLFELQTSLTIPLYFPTLIFVLLPAHYFLRVRRQRRIANRRAQGCCIFCGYDLRASAGRCPECGKVA